MRPVLSKIKNSHAVASFCLNLLPFQCERHDCWSKIHIRTFFLGDPLLVRGKKSFGIKNLEKEDDLRRKDPAHFGKIIGLDPSEVEINEQDYSLNLNKKSKKLEMRIRNKPFKNNSFETDINNKKMDYEKLGKNSVLLCSKVPNLKVKKLRNKKKQIMIEGKRLISEAISAGCLPTEIYFSRIQDLNNFKIPENVKLYKTSYKQIQLWSDVVTSQGVLGIFKMPQLHTPKVKTIPLTIICDNIRDPGNLGAILRVASSVGCEKLLLTKGCVDIWEPKVLRSAAGCHFRITAMHNLNWSDIKNEIGKDCRIVIAENAPPVEDKVVNDCEKSDTFKTKSNKFGTDLPVHDYFSLDYSDGHTVIVIGGEAHGLSKDAYEFAQERQGVRISIPMCNQVESLNTAVALGILSYEVKRQRELVLKNSKNVYDSVENVVSE